jgi:plastocyanin
MMRTLYLLMLVACTNHNSSQTDAPANSGGDSSASGIVMVTCSNPEATITTSGFTFTPNAVTITQGQVIRFQMPDTHNVVPGHQPADSTISDPGLNVDFNTTKCLMFTRTGTYGFHCQPHGFNGTVTVQ